MLLSLWGLALVLVLVMFLAASVNLGLRSRAIMAVRERLEHSGRDRELRWLTDVRDELNLATATVRTFASLGLILDIVALCEAYGLSTWPRNALAFVSAFFVILLFGVAIPSAIAKYAAGAVVAWAVPSLKLLHLAVYPMLRGLDAVDVVLRRLMGVKEESEESQAEHLEQELMNVMSEGELQGTVDDRETAMIRSVIEFGDTEVAEIMTPRTDVVAIDKTATLKKAKALITEEGHSRIPVYDGTVDRILGVLYAKDLLSIENNQGFDICKIMRSVPFIPDNKPVAELLTELKEVKVHMAIVLDEYGGTSGLVTIEDILEELVGEIEDEYETPEPSPLERIDASTVDVDARMRIDELNDELSLALPENDDYETIGGFVFSRLGKIPQVGEQCDHENVRISVIAAEARRINRVRLHLPTGNNHDAKGANGI